MISVPKFAVSIFMSRVSELGFIRCNGPIQVHQSLLNKILLERLRGNSSASTEIVQPAL
jgi:hypothetical protein